MSLPAAAPGVMSGGGRRGSCRRAGSALPGCGTRLLARAATWPCRPLHPLLRSCCSCMARVAEIPAPILCDLSPIDARVRSQKRSIFTPGMCHVSHVRGCDALRPGAVHAVRSRAVGVQTPAPMRPLGTPTPAPVPPLPVSALHDQLPLCLPSYFLFFRWYKSPLAGYALSCTTIADFLDASTI